MPNLSHYINLHLRPDPETTPHPAGKISVSLICEVVCQVGRGRPPPMADGVRGGGFLVVRVLQRAGGRSAGRWRWC